MMKKEKKLSIMGILLLSLFLVPPAMYYVLPPTIDPYKDTTVSYDDVSPPQIPLSAGLSVNKLEVNGTQLYEDGIYYCFRNDTINVEVYTSSNVDNVTLDIGLITDPTQNFPTMTLDLLQAGATENLWNLTFYIDGNKGTGMYNSTLTLIDLDTGASDIFHFNFSIMNPKPRILRAYMQDTVYLGNNKIPVFEGVIYKTYHFAELNFTANVVNIDGLSKIDTVTLVYENGNHITNATKTLSPQYEEQVGSYTTIYYSMDELLTIDISDASDLSKNNWTMGNRYQFKLVVNDTEGNSFDFCWEIYISNHPPQITEFQVSPSYSASEFDSATQLNFTVTVNGTDLENDIMFGANTIYNVSSVFQPSAAGPMNNSLANITDWDDFEDALYNIYADDSKEQNFTYPSTAGAAYGVNFTLGKDYDFNDDDLYHNFYLQFVFHIYSQIPDLTFYIYDYSLDAWVSVAASILPLGNLYTDVTLTFFNDTTHDQEIWKYFGTVGDQEGLLQVKLVSTSSGIDYFIGIDKVEVGFKVERRVTFSDIYLNVYLPASANPIVVNMKNCYMIDWDSGGTLARWAFNFTYPVTNSSTEGLRGVWSFVLKIYDYGTKSYSEINPNEEDGISPLSSVSFSSSDKTRGMAVTTRLIRVGVDDWTPLLDVNNVSTTDPTPNSSTNTTISVTLNDYDYTNSYKIVNYTFAPQGDSMEIQNGDPWTPPNTNYNVTTLLPGDQDWNYPIVGTGRVLPDDSGNLTDPGAMLVNDTKPFRFSVNEDPYVNLTFAYIVPFKINQKYWLGKDNISAIWINVTQNAEWTAYLSTFGFGNASVQFWNFETLSWVTPNEGDPTSEWYEDYNANQSVLMKFDNEVHANETWSSPEWNQTDIIKQCIKEDIDNTGTDLMYVRFLISMGGTELDGGIHSALNISIDYLKMTVEYNNTYWCKLHLWSNLDNTPSEYVMTQTATGTNTRTWSYELPTAILSARDYAFSIEAQNENSSIHLFMGRFEGVASNAYTGVFTYDPFYQEGVAVNTSYVIKAEPSSVNFTTITFASITDLHRYIEPLLFNGTISSRFPLYSFSEAILELRQYNMESQSEWIRIEGQDQSVEGGLQVFTWNNETGEWEINLMFGHNLGGIVWRSGVWYYRVLVRTNESVVNATDWGEFRLQNFQPRSIELSGLPSGSYYRVKDPVNYYISFVDMEGDNSTFNDAAGYEYNISISFYVQNRDKGLIWEKWDSHTAPFYDNVTPLENRFAFHGSLTFGREIQIGNYTDVYIKVKDQDIDWPQVGTLRITDRWFNILNNPPRVETYLTTNSTDPGMEDKVYRNNWIKIITNVTDIDDFDYIIKPDYFNLTYVTDYNGGTAVSDLNSSIHLVNYTDLGYKQWEYDLFVSRLNKTGFWNFTCNFHDPDGDHLVSGPMYLTIEVLNNLPVVQNIKLEIEETKDLAYYYNESAFGIYRGNETLSITADIYDEEDTWLEETGYQIKAVSFELVNTYANLNEVFSDENFTFTLEKTGEVTSPETTMSDTYNVASFSGDETDFEDNVILSVKNQDGALALPRDLENIDGNYLNLQYYYSIVQPQGGEFYFNLTHLPLLFDLHTSNQVYNLTFHYQALQGGYNVYVYNVENDSWDLLGSLTSSDWETLNLSIPADEIRNYASETYSNLLQFKINSTDDQVEGTPGILNIDLLTFTYTRDVDEHYERWTCTVTLPNGAVTTSDGESIYLHAGSMTLRMKMLDHDNDYGYDEETVLNVLNARPQFIGRGVWVLDEDGNEMYPNANNSIYYNAYSTTGNDPYIEVYINAKDDDGDPGELGIKKIKVEGGFLAGGFFNVFSREVEAEEVMKDGNTTLFVVRIYLSDFNADDVAWFTLSTVTITDFDDGYCDPRVFPTSDSVTNLNIKIYYKGESNVVEQFNWKLMFGIVGGVALVGLGFVFYRKFISYRKYLDKED